MEFLWRPMSGIYESVIIKFKPTSHLPKKNTYHSSIFHSSLLLELLELLELLVLLGLLGVPGSHPPKISIALPTFFKSFFMSLTSFFFLSSSGRFPNSQPL
jgi:hypothetical protein